jgi:hypothetical protein
VKRIPVLGITEKNLQEVAYFSPLKNLQLTTTFLHPVTTQTPHFYHQKTPRFSLTPFKKPPLKPQKSAAQPLPKKITKTNPPPIEKSCAGNES